LCVPARLRRWRSDACRYIGNLRFDGASRSSKLWRRLRFRTFALDDAASYPGWSAFYNVPNLQSRLVDAG
ncbi:MAG: hypothetical protein ACRDFS_12320, partial [Chloroflexota bacterium]